MRSIVLVIIAFGLTACPFTVNQLNRLPASQPLAQPVLFNRPGPLLHEASGFEFPDWYDNFQRVTAYRYDTGGLDVGIGYNDRRPDCLIAATFYVYPTPRMSFVGASADPVASMERGWLNNEFARAKAGIEHHHPAMQSPVIGPAEYAQWFISAPGILAHLPRGGQRLGTAALRLRPSVVSQVPFLVSRVLSARGKLQARGDDLTASVGRRPTPIRPPVVNRQ